MMNLSKFFVFVTMFTFLLIAGYLGYRGGELQDFLRKRNEKMDICDKLGLLDSNQSRGTRGNRERKSIRNTTYNSDAKVMSSVSQGSDDSPKSVTHGVSVDRDQPQVRALDKKNQYATNAGRLRRGIALFGDVKSALNRSPLIASSKDGSYIPGSVADVFVHENLTIGIVSVRGLSHEENKKVRQDSVAFGTSLDGRYLVGSIADGVSEADLSHKGSDYVAREVVKSICEKIDIGLHPKELPWEDITNHIRDGLRVRGKRAFGIPKDMRGQELDDCLARLVGTTAEVLIIDCKKTNNQVVGIRASLAGDGYSFIIRNGSMISLGGGKDAFFGGDYVSNEKVRALPKDPGVKYPLVNEVKLLQDEAIFITSDGIGDDINKPDLGVDAYLHRKLAKPVPAYELLKIISYFAFQSHDDRSMIIVWV